MTTGEPIQEETERGEEASGEGPLLQQLLQVKKLALTYMSANIELLQLKMWQFLFVLILILLTFFVIGGSILIGLAWITFSIAQLFNQYVAAPDQLWTGPLVSGVLILTIAMTLVKTYSYSLKKKLLVKVREKYKNIIEAYQKDS